MYRTQFHAFNWHNNRQKFIDGAILLPTPYVIHTNGSADAFAHFMGILNGVKSHFPRKALAFCGC
jgi:hypothetical protein